MDFRRWLVLLTYHGQSEPPHSLTGEPLQPAIRCIFLRILTLRVLLTMLVSDWVSADLTVVMPPTRADGLLPIPLFLGGWIFQHTHPGPGTGDSVW